MRNLQNDLELCNKATPGPWEYKKAGEWPSYHHYHRVVNAEDGRFKIADKHPHRGEENLVCEAYSQMCWTRGDFIIANMEFIAQAREGWPHSIERAIEAETKLTKIQRILREPAPFGAVEEQLEQIREVVECTD